MTTTEQTTRYSVANQSDAYATDACILTDCGTEGLCGQWFDYRTSSRPSTEIPAGKRVCTRCLDVLHAYALKINPRGVIEIEITGSEHGWGTRITSELDSEDTVCEGHYDEDSVLLSGNPGGPMFCDGSCRVPRIVKPCRMEDGYICGVTGTKTCTTDPKKQAACPSC